MSTTIFKNSTDIKLLPLRAVQLFSLIALSDPYDANLIIYKPEKESNYKITNITVKNDNGKFVTIGQKFEANIYVSYNEYQTNNLIFHLDEIFKSRYTLSLYFGNATPWTDPLLALTSPAVINKTGGLRISIANGVSHWHEIEGVEYRPRMIIHFEASLKGKLNANNIFL